jgi:hypothetical protein
VVAAHASLLRLVGLAAVAPILILPEEEAPLPAAGDLVTEIDQRGEAFAGAHEEWLARLLADNPIETPAFRTFFAGLSQSLRAAVALRDFSLESDVEPILGAVVSWQPHRWPSLRAGAPSKWIETLCPLAPAGETPRERLDRERTAALDLVSRLWFAKGASAAGLTALSALFVARCASLVALWEELGGGAAVQ